MARRMHYLAIAAAVVLTTAGLAAAAGPAQAAPVPVTTGASASSLPAYVGTASLAAQLSLTGLVGGLLDGIVTPIVNSALDPLVSALQGTLSGTVASTLGVSSAYAAGAPTQQAAPAPGSFPGDLPSGLPAPCTLTSATQPCYSGTGAPASGLALAPLAGIGVGAVRGYTQQVTAAADSTNPIFGRAQVANASVSVLPAVTSLVNPVVSASTIDALASCPATGTPTATAATATVSLLGGAAGLTVSSGAIASVKVGSTTYSLTNLPSATVAGFTLSAYGSALKLSVPLTLSQVLTGLGLGAGAITELLGDALPSASLTLSLVVGPNIQVGTKSAAAWGLGIGVDLAGSLGFTLAGLVGATVAVPSGIGGGNFGNVLDARLAYASCLSGSGGGPTNGGTAVVPPSLI